MVFYLEEQEVLEKLITGLKKKNPQLAGSIDLRINNLENLAEVVKSYPSLRAEEKLGRRFRSEETLIKKLCSQSAIENSLYLPTQVELGYSYLKAKINFLLMLKYHAEIGARFKNTLTGYWKS